MKAIVKSQRATESRGEFGGCRAIGPLLSIPYFYSSLNGFSFWCRPSSLPTVSPSALLPSAFVNLSVASNVSFPFLAPLVLGPSLPVVPLLLNFCYVKVAINPKVL